MEIANFCKISPINAIKKLNKWPLEIDSKSSKLRNKESNVIKFEKYIPMVSTYWFYNNLRNLSFVDTSYYYKWNPFC
jgi:hypothetical protein